MESQKIRQMRKRNLSSLQEEFLVGTLLGDGFLMATTMGYCLRIHQGIKWKDFVDWKYEIMKDFVNTPPKFDGKGFYFRTVTNPIFSTYRKLFYDRKQKIIPDNLGEILSSFGLAIWIMDDGSKKEGCMRIHTYSFSYQDHLKIQEALKNKFGIKCNIHRDKGMFRLYVVSESIERLVKLVKPYFIPSMLYKLPRNDFGPDIMSGSG